MHPKIVSVAMAALCTLAAIPVIAHHSFAEYDNDNPVSLEGEVQELRMLNPHSRLHITVTKEDGSVEEWQLELGAPSALQRRGVTPSTLPSGTRLSVTGFPARDGALRLAPRSIAFSDGREFAWE
jgi:hypothetical protein